MEGSYRQSLIHELGNCQEGKYEEGKEKEKGKWAGETRYLYLTGALLSETLFAMFAWFAECVCLV
jgi:hypothetical protein